MIMATVGRSVRAANGKTIRAVIATVTRTATEIIIGIAIAIKAGMTVAIIIGIRIAIATGIAVVITIATATGNSATRVTIRPSGMIGLSRTGSRWIATAVRGNGAMIDSDQHRSGQPHGAVVAVAVGGGN